MLPAPTFERSNEFAQRADSAVWAGRLFFFLRRGLSLQIPFIHKTLNLSDLPFLPISALVTGVFLFISSSCQVDWNNGARGPLSLLISFPAGPRGGPFLLMTFGNVFLSVTLTSLSVLSF